MAWRLAPSRRLLVASPAYLARHGTPASLAELEGHRGIFYTNRGIADWRFAGAEGRDGAARGSRLRVNNGDMMRDAAIAGLGIALLPSLHRRAGDPRRRLTIIDIGRQAGGGIHLHGPSRRPTCLGQAQALVEQPAPGLRRSALLGFEARHPSPPQAFNGGPWRQLARVPDRALPSPL